MSLSFNCNVVLQLTGEPAGVQDQILICCPLMPVLHVPQLCPNMWLGAGGVTQHHSDISYIVDPLPHAELQIHRHGNRLATIPTRRVAHVTRFSGPQVESMRDTPLLPRRAPLMAAHMAISRASRVHLGSLGPTHTHTYQHSTPTRPARTTARPLDEKSEHDLPKTAHACQSG